jgi:DNA polymerase-1
VDGSWLMAVDGTGLFVRCSRAGRHTGMTAPDGTPTGALTLFAGSLAAMVRSVQPRYLVIAWDGGNGTAWRKRIVPEYKSNRLTQEYPPWDTREFDAVREFCNAAQIAQWCLDDFEGDDMLAAASRAAHRDLPGARVVLASDDNDIAQLAVPHRVWTRGLGRDGELASAEDIEMLWGVPPGVVPLYRALAGDPSDGIRGLRSVGPVRAVKMIRDSPSRYPGPGSVLAAGAQRDQVEAWLSVMDLNSPPDAPESHDVTGILDIRKTEWERGNLLPVLEKYGMRRMAERWSRGLFW